MNLFTKTATLTSLALLLTLGANAKEISTEIVKPLINIQKMQKQLQYDT